jgi:hypothetical protein
MFTPWNYKLVIINNKIQILPEKTIVPNGSYEDLDPTSLISDSPLLWPQIISALGVFRPGISQIRLNRPPVGAADTVPAIVGTIVIDPNDERLVLYDVDPDTAPQNTLSPIDAIINPLLSGPGAGLPAPVTGTRYLLTEGTGGSRTDPYFATAWAGTSNQPLIADANDIIQYNGSRWIRVFVSRDETAGQYVTNITTNIQYEWTGDQWIKSYQGVYPGGAWQLVL